MLTRVNEVGLRRLDEWMTMACDLLSFITIPLSQSHAFASCMQASIHSVCTVRLEFRQRRSARRRARFASGRWCVTESLV